MKETTHIYKIAMTRIKRNIWGGGSDRKEIEKKRVGIFFIKNILRSEEGRRR